MPSLRFDNQLLQSKFLEGLKTLTFRVQIAADGTVICTGEQWPEVNGVAHRVRDSCFRWYFSWCDSAESAAELERHLRDNGLRFEIEHHEDRRVFLLPKEDEDKHWPPGDTSGPVQCSFCKGMNTERSGMYAVGDVAICDECITWLYAELKRDRGGAA